jgi:hypothetical protein
VPLRGTVKENSSGLSIPGVNVQIKIPIKESQLILMVNFKGISILLFFILLRYKSVEYKVTASNNNMSVLMQDDAKL